MLSFSIVINTFNRASSLRQTLEGLTLLDYPWFEVVVVNGPSTDDTEAVLAEFGSRIKVARLDERNLSVSRNLGIAAAAGDIVAFIDDDAYPDPAWLDRLVEAYERDEVAGAGGPTYDYTGYKLQACYILTNRLGDSQVSGPEAMNPTEFASHPFSGLFPSLLGTNSSFRRSAMIEIGGFDEEFDYYLDETDVCIRLIDRGYVVRTLSDGYVYHKFLASHLRTPTRSLRDRFSVLKNRVYFAFKHGSATLSAFDICRDLTAFVQHQRNDFRWNVDHGYLTPQDFERFEADVHRAFDIGFARYRAKQERTRSADWFAVRQTGFLPFVTRRPAAEKLHLCFLSLEYPPGPINGIARFTHEMSVGLAELGHNVHVLTLGEHHNRVDLEDGVWVHRIVPTVRKRPANPIVPQDNWNYSASLHEEVLRIHRHRALDLVESPIWDSEGIATLLDGEVPVIVSLHTPLPVALEINPHWGADPTVRESRIEPLVALERFCLEHCEAILANSEAIVAEIESGHRLTLDRTRLRVVPHGFGASTVSGPISPDMKKGLNVLFVGRLERRKGIDTLLEAIPVLLERFPEMNFTIVGDDTIPTAEGPTYREAFQARADSDKIAERVTFTGRIGDPHLAAFYAGCDIFVAPSRYESFGLIFIEAMAHGKPVIGCDAGGMREVIAPGENGLLVPPGDAQALADAIATLAADADLRGRMSARAREIYEGRFTRRIMAEAAEDFYRDFVARRTARPGGPRQIEAA